MPSTDYVNDEINNRYGKNGMNLDKIIVNCIKTQVRDNMDTLVVPYKTHKNKSDKTASNRKVVKEEREEYRKNNGKDRTLEEQSEYEADEMEKSVDETMQESECKEKIKKELDFFRNLPDNYFKDLFDQAKKHCTGGNSAPSINNFPTEIDLMGYDGGTI